MCRLLPRPIRVPSCLEAIQAGQICCSQGFPVLRKTREDESSMQKATRLTQPWTPRRRESWVNMIKQQGSTSFEMVENLVQKFVIDRISKIIRRNRASASVRRNIKYIGSLIIAEREDAILVRSGTLNKDDVGKKLCHGSGKQGIKNS